MADPTIRGPLHDSLTRTLVTPMVQNLAGVQRMAERIKALEADRAALIGKVHELKGRLKQHESPGTGAAATTEENTPVSSGDVSPTCKFTTLETLQKAASELSFPVGDLQVHLYTLHPTDGKDLPLEELIRECELIGAEEKYPPFDPEIHQKWKEISFFFERFQKWCEAGAALDKTPRRLHPLGPMSEKEAENLCLQFLLSYTDLFKDIRAYGKGLEKAASSLQRLEGRMAVPAEASIEGSDGLLAQMEKFARRFRKMLSALEKLGVRIEIPLTESPDGRFFLDRGILKSAIAYLSSGKCPVAVTFMKKDQVFHIL